MGYLYFPFEIVYRLKSSDNYNNTFVIFTLGGLVMFFILQLELLSV